MLKKKLLPVLLLPLLLWAGCGSNNNQLARVTFRGEVFGTYYTISYFEEDAINYQQEIDSLLEDFNQSLSYYQPNSVISRINRNETDVTDKYFRTVFQRAQQISETTGGAFDVTVAPLVNAWGFGFTEKETMTPEKIDSLQKLVGYERVSLEGQRIVKQDPAIQFDFNSIAKGYAADVVGAFLEDQGIEAYMVEIGGDLMVKGLKPDGSQWRIGMEKPAANSDAPQQWDFYVELKDQAVATSGNYRRYYEEDGQRYSHTIDPVTGYPVSHNLLSVSVFAPDAMTADAFATAFMVMGLQRSIEFAERNQQLEAYFIFSDGQDSYGTYATPGLELISREAL